MRRMSVRDGDRMKEGTDSSEAGDVDDCECRWHAGGGLVGLA